MKQNTPPVFLPKLLDDDNSPGVLSRMSFSDWLRYSLSIKQIDYELESVRLLTKWRSLLWVFEGDLDFERLVDLYKTK